MYDTFYSSNNYKPTRLGNWLQNKWASKVLNIFNNQNSNLRYIFKISPER